MASYSGVGASTFDTDSGSAVDLDGTITMAGGTNINTDSAADNTVTINLDDTVSLVGSLTAGTGITAISDNIVATAGNIILSSGNLELPLTNAAGDEGVILFGGQRLISNYGTLNTFVGALSGNTTLTVGSAFQNTGVGCNSLNNIVDGQSNTAVGANALASVTSGENLIALGVGTGSAYSTNESNNIVIGNSGIISESNVIRIGTSGSGAGQQNKCFIAAIRDTTAHPSSSVHVLIDSDGQLGTITSSIKVKENISDIGEDSTRIYNLRPVLFNYKGTSEDESTYGLIAEEVDKVFPELVVYDREGNPETVKYRLLSILLLNEVKKLQARIKKLEILIS